MKEDKPEPKKQEPKKGVDTVKNILKAIGFTFLGTLFMCYIFFALTDVAVEGDKCNFIFGSTKLTWKECKKVDKNGNIQVNIRGGK